MRRRNKGLAKDLAILAACGALFVSAHMIVWEMDKAHAKAIEAQNREREAAAIVATEMVESVTPPLPPCSIAVDLFYPVPLDADLQAFIINECSAYDIDPALVMAVIDRESEFRADAVGDNCNSFGLMQIQKRWHEDRMERLGCDDLMNPYQNVTVSTISEATIATASRSRFCASMAFAWALSISQTIIWADTNKTAAIARRARSLSKHLFFLISFTPWE